MISFVCFIGDIISLLVSNFWYDRSLVILIDLAGVVRTVTGVYSCSLKAHTISLLIFRRGASVELPLTASVLLLLIDFCVLVLVMLDRVPTGTDFVDVEPLGPTGVCSSTGVSERGRGFSCELATSTVSLKTTCLPDCLSFLLHIANSMLVSVTWGCIITCDVDAVCDAL